MKTKPLGVRFEVRAAELLTKVCQLRGEDVSDFVRRAVLTELAELSYLSDEEKKALGLLKRKKTGLPSADNREVRVASSLGDEAMTDDSSTSPVLVRRLKTCTKEKRKV